MIWLIIIPLFIISVHFLFTLFAIGRKKKFKRELEKKSSDFYPPLNIFVPCKGWNKDLYAYLSSILNQDYGNYKVIFITESEEDKSNIEIEKLVKEYDKAIHIISGKAEKCAQKNHNLLKAIEKYSDSDIFVFCDSDLLYDKNWLSNLVKPFSDENISFSASFYSVEGQENNKNFASIFYSGFSFFTLMMLLGVDAIWGGSMAMRKSTFERLGIAELWKKTVVDDMTTAKIVKKEKEKVFIVYPNGLKSFISDSTSLKNVFRWSKRQVLYLKYYLKLYWLLLMAIYIPITTAMLSVPVLFIFLLFGRDASTELISYSIVSVLMILNYALIVLMNEDKVTPRHLIYMLPILVLVSYVLISTIFTTRLIWSGYIYKVKLNGEVKSIELA
jgi:cellulose synthase/poly-beta-1,6-N-acetylglucosamine synthase-like glycosyltransferase